MFLSRFRWSAKRLRLLHDSLGSARLGSVLATVDWLLARQPVRVLSLLFWLHSTRKCLALLSMSYLRLAFSALVMTRATDERTMGHRYDGTIGSLSLSWAWHTPRSFAGSLTRWRSEPLFCCPKVSWQECYGRQVWPSCAAICTFGVRNLLGYLATVFHCNRQNNSAITFGWRRS